MNIFKLQYTEASGQTNSEFESEYHYEVFGSRKAIFSLWFQLTQNLQSKGSAYPRFVKVFDTNGIEQKMENGVAAMSTIGTYE